MVKNKMGNKKELSPIIKVCLEEVKKKEEEKDVKTSEEMKMMKRCN